MGTGITRRGCLGRVLRASARTGCGAWWATRRSPADAGADRWLEEALALHRKVPVFMGYFVFHPEQFQERGGVQSDLEKLDVAGVRTFVCSVGFGYRGPRQPYFQVGTRQYVMAGPDEWLLERQLERVDELVAAIRKQPRTRLITRASELAPGPDDSMGVIVHLTGNNHTLDVGTVDTFFTRGVRATHPAMEYHSRWCASLRGMEAPVLTGFGRQVIARMNELGIAIDTGHASDESAVAFVESSSRPINDSHTASRDRVPGCRGLRDQTLRRIAGSGGVVGVHFADHFLTPQAWTKKYDRRPAQPRNWQFNQYVLGLASDPDERIRLRNDPQLQARFYRERGLPPDPDYPRTPAATLLDLADTIDHLVKLVGIDHVGLGGDVNGIDGDQWPQGMSHIGQLPRLTAELLRRGYRADELTKLLSNNWRRVYAATLPS